MAFSINPTADSGQTLDALLELGITSVAAGEFDPVSYYDRDVPDHRAIESFASEISQRNMKVLAAHGVGGFVSIDQDRQPHTVEHLKHEVDRAVAWSSRSLVFHHRQVAQAWSSVEMAEWTVHVAKMGLDKYDKIYHETLLDLCAYAEDKGLAICLETLGPPFSYGHCVEQVLPTVERLNCRNLRICVDTGHVYLSGHDPAAQIRRAHGWLGTLHVHDNYGPIPPDYDIYSSDLHLVPGFGGIDWVAVILAVGAVGYAGPYIFEDVNYPGSSFKDAVKMTMQNWSVFKSLADELGPRGYALAGKR